MVARRIGISRQHVTGRIATSKSATGAVAFESTLERDFYILLDFDPAVIRIEEQPLSVSWIDAKGDHHQYTPDVLAHYSEGARPVLWEVKPLHKLGFAIREQRRAYRAALGSARANGWVFHFITERQIRTPLLHNARFLRPYRTDSPNHDVTDMLLTALRGRGQVPLDGLVRSVPLPTERVWPVVWTLLAQFRLVVDLTIPLTASSMACLPHE